jgi:hypothetical protein
MTTGGLSIPGQLARTIANGGCRIPTHPSDSLSSKLWSWRPRLGLGPSMADACVAPKPWHDRANTIGYITGGTEARVFVLRQVLSKLPADGKAILTWAKPNGKEASAVCEDLCSHQLSASELAERTFDGQWIPTKPAAAWLENDAPVFLAAHFHANVKFFGELLEAIGQQPRTPIYLK